MKTVVFSLIFIFSVSLFAEDAYFFDGNYEIYENFDGFKDSLITNSYTFYKNKMPELFYSTIFNVNSGGLYVEDKHGANYIPESMKENAAFNRYKFNDLNEFFLYTKKHDFTGFYFHLTLLVKDFIEPENRKQNQLFHDGVYLVLRYMDIHNYYMIPIFTKEQRVYLMKKCEAVHKDFADEDGGFFYDASDKIIYNKRFIKNKYYDILVDVDTSEKNPRFKLFIDGEKVLDVKDELKIKDMHNVYNTLIETGGVGIRTKNCQIQFDDFWIKRKDE